MAPSNELPTTSRSTYLVDNHATKVKELLGWIRLVKTTGIILIMTICVNFVLMYGLIRYPCSPTPSRCIPYCTSISHARDLDLAPFSLALPEISPVLEAQSPNEVSIEVKTSLTRGMEPRSATSTEIGAHLDDRQYKWWYLAMAGFWVTNQAVSWWNMVGACEDFSDASNVINCVWGAVTTSITAAGAFWGGYQTVGRIQTWANNNGITFGGFKRDLVAGSVDAELLDAFSALMLTPVTHLGVFDYAGLGLNGTLAQRRSTEPLDVFGFTSPEGLQMHFSFLGYMENMAGNNKGQFALKFGLGNGTTNGTTSSGVKGRALFDQQYFTSGGIDFIFDDNPGDGGQLNTNYDYGQMNHEVSCYMGGSSDAAGHYFQIYDNNHDGTIAGGAVAPFRGSDHWSAITQMYDEPFPVRLTPSCEVS